jgi:hypothetical protein
MTSLRFLDRKSCACWAVYRSINGDANRSRRNVAVNLNLPLIYAISEFDIAARNPDARTAQLAGNEQKQVRRSLDLESRKRRFLFDVIPRKLVRCLRCAAARAAKVKFEADLIDFAIQSERTGNLITLTVWIINDSQSMIRQAGSICGA